MQAAPAGLQIDQIPDEVGELLPGDRVRIHVTLADGRVLADMVIEPDEWSWMQS